MDGTIERKPGSGRKSSITAEVEAIVEEQVKQDDEMTASQLRALLNSQGHYLAFRRIVFLLLH